MTGAGAQLAFVGGPVHGHPGATALAVRGGRIVAIGADATRALIGPRTEIVDLAGARLLPGFQDAHVHAVWGGVELGLCELSGADTAAAYLDLVAAYATANPVPEWITGGGWSLDAFPGGQPTRELLDAVAPDRPVYLLNRDHHGAWVNTRALRAAGITARTPDPPGGRIERDRDGEASGMLQESAVDLVGRLAPAWTAGQLRAGLARAQAMLHGYGVTAWQDACVGDALGQPDVLSSYVDAAAAGTLTARVRGALWWRRDAGLEQLDELLKRRERAGAGPAVEGSAGGGPAREGSAGDGRFRATTVKIMVDGICENHTAALGSPYLDGCGAAGCETGDPAHELPTAGLTFVDSGELHRAVTALDRAGFQVHFHALGDRAVRVALDAVAAARAANGPSGLRHHLAHLQVVDPLDVPRFAELDAVANIQALWAAHEPQMDTLNIPFLGARRTGWQYPFGSLHAAGARLAAGSDWPVSSADPWQAIHVAVNRVLPGGAAPVFLPGQRLDLATAVAAYTAGSAWVNGLDDTGTIRLGARADLAVLDRDPFAGRPQEIASTRVTQTFVDGVRVHPG